MTRREHSQTHFIRSALTQPKRQIKTVEKQTKNYINISDEERCKNSQKKIANQIQKHINGIIHHG